MCRESLTLTGSQLCFPGLFLPDPEKTQFGSICYGQRQIHSSAATQDTCSRLGKWGARLKYQASFFKGKLMAWPHWELHARGRDLWKKLFLPAWTAASTLLKGPLRISKKKYLKFLIKMFPIISYSTDLKKKKKIKKTLIKEWPISYTRFKCRASSVHQMHYLLPHLNTQPDSSMLHLVLDQGSPFSVTSV